MEQLDVSACEHFDVLPQRSTNVAAPHLAHAEQQLLVGAGEVEADGRVGRHLRGSAGEGTTLEFEFEMIGVFRRLDNEIAHLQRPRAVDEGIERQCGCPRRIAMRDWTSRYIRNGHTRRHSLGDQQPAAEVAGAVIMNEGKARAKAERPLGRRPRRRLNEVATRNAADERIPCFIRLRVRQRDSTEGA